MVHYVAAWTLAGVLVLAAALKLRDPAASQAALAEKEQSWATICQAVGRILENSRGQA